MLNKVADDFDSCRHTVQYVSDHNKSFGYKRGANWEVGEELLWVEEELSKEKDFVWKIFRRGRKHNRFWQSESNGKGKGLGRGCQQSEYGSTSTDFES